MEQFDSPFSAQERLDHDRDLQRMFEVLVASGAAGCGYALCAFFDHANVSADAVKDYFAKWVGDQEGWRFDQPPPRRKPARPVTHLRLVSPDPDAGA